MTALTMMLCGEIKKSVEHREKEFKTYEELRTIAMNWAINRKIENERSVHDPMDCNQAQEWGAQEDWGWPAGIQEEMSPPPMEVNYVNAKGKGKGDWNSKGGKGLGNQSSPAQYHMMMAMKAMKGNSKGFNIHAAQYSQGKGGKGGGKSGGKD